MGNWSPYSEEWEKQHARKVIENANAARIEFEKKPWVYKAIVRASGTISYYWSLLIIRVRMFFDQEYRDEVNRVTKDLEEKGIKAIADILTDDTEKQHDEDS